MVDCNNNRNPKGFDILNVTTKVWTAFFTASTFSAPKISLSNAAIHFHCAHSGNTTTTTMGKCPLCGI
jgi:hypothetical protein